jgi:translation initiation factor IF-1
VKTVTFHPGPLRIQLKPGGSDNIVFAVLRKVPQGYTAPNITVVGGNTTFVDVMNVLAYGMVRVQAASGDPMNRIDMRILRKSIPMARGDSVILQVVPNANSSGQQFSALFEYSTT